MFGINSFALPNAACAVLIFGIGLFVLYKDRRSQINLSFFLLSMSALIWQIGTFLVVSSKTPEAALFWCRRTYLGSLFIPITTYHFIVSALHIKGQKVFVYLSYLTGFLIFFPLSQTNLFITGVNVYYWGYWWKVGPAHPFFLLLLSILITASFFNLLSAYQNSKSVVDRTRVEYLFVAFLIAYIGAIDYVPNYGVEIYPFGYLAVIIFIFISAYAITKAHLMDISVVISRTLAYFFAVVFYLLLYAGLLFVFKASGALPWLQAIGSMVFIATAVVSFYPLQQFIQTASDKAFIKGTYDPVKVMSKLTNKLVGSLTVQDAIASTKEILKDDVEITSASFYLIEDFGKREPTGSFICRDEGQEKKLDQQDLIVQVIKSKKDIVFTRELDTPEIKDRLMAEDRELIKNAVIVLPVMAKEGMTAFLALGRKYSEEAYKSQDLDFLRMIAGQLAIVFERIQPYEQVKDDYQKSLEAAEKADRLAALGTLAMGIAHEIRNPMSALSLQAELLPGKLDDKEFLIRFAEIIPRNIFRLLNITEKMLSFGSPKQEGQTTVSVNDLVDDVMVLSDSKIKKQNVKVTQELGRVPQIKADKNGVSQVLINLVFNALDAMAEEGELTIRTKTGDVLQKGGTKVPGVVIEIKDSGKGMPPEVLAKIFTPFFTTRHEGTGLGLSTAARIVYEHNGTIDVTSQVGKGTLFTVSLPLAL